MIKLNKKKDETLEEKRDRIKVNITACNILTFMDIALAGGAIKLWQHNPKTLPAVFAVIGLQTVVGGFLIANASEYDVVEAKINNKDETNKVFSI